MEKMEKDILEERIIKGATDHDVSHSRMGGGDRPIYINIYKLFIYIFFYLLMKLGGTAGD